MNVVEFLQTIVVSGAAVTAIVQFLKSNFVPATVFNKYPRTTTFLASVAAVLFTVWQECQNLVTGCQTLLQQPLDYVAAVVGIFLIAVTLYNGVLRDKPHSQQGL